MEKDKREVTPLKVVAVSRGSEFSPNHINNDAAILTEVVNNLKKNGIKSRVISEKEFVSEDIECDFIFDMARDRRSLKRLKELENSGLTVVNSAFGIENCSLSEMTRLLLDNNIPHPKSSIVSTDENILQDIFPCWIKRGDSHAMVKDDVSYAKDQAQFDRVFEDFRSRGIHSAVINEHLQGDLIKFYGVKDTDFFYWFYPSPCSHSKFGLEKINGVSKGFEFSLSDLKKYSDLAAQVLNVPIYGGDCVVSENGDIKIIDFNDWPSFARCREEAGAKIAEYILHKINEINNS